jgi:F0F1-type ATP synthase gamma subunit
VVASDLGLCGDYNARLAQHTVAEYEHRKLGLVYSVGRRVQPMIARAGIMPQYHYEAPASLAGLSRLLLHLAQDIFEDYVAARISSLYLFRRVLMASATLRRCVPACSPSSRCMWAPGGAHHTSLRSPGCGRGAEFLYISLYEVLLDALASEHGMRLTATEAALQWIDTTSEQPHGN